MSARALAAWALAAAALLPPRPASALEPKKPLDLFPRRVWARADGLPSASVTAIAQTPDGYLWLGTDAGLARFDGTAFTVFDRISAPALRSQTINALLVGRRGELWIATEAGVARVEGGLLTDWGRDAGLPDQRVWAIGEQRPGLLWVGTPYDVYRCEDARCVAVRDVDDRIIECGAFWFGDAGEVWCGGAELIALEPRPMRHISIGAPTRIDSLAPAPGGFWIGAENGLFRFDGERIEPVPHPDALSIKDLRVDSSGALWIASLFSGAFRYRDGRFEPVPGLGTNDLNALFEDREGSMWLGTEAGGLVQLRDALFSTYSVEQGLSTRNSMSVLVDRRGDVWVGTQEGLNVLHDGGVEQLHAPAQLTSDFIVGLHEGADGAIFAATFGGGVDRIADGVLTTVGETEGLPSNDAMVVTSQGETLWIATMRGLARLEPGALTRYNEPNGMPGLTIAMHPARDGTLWVAGFYGLCRIEPDRCVLLPWSQGQRVQTLHEDAAGALWVSLHEGGLYRLRDGQLAHVGREQGLPSDSVFAIVEDGLGALWMGSSDGFFQVPAAELDAVADGRAGRVTATPYGLRDGIRGDPQGGVQPTAARGPDGRLWFATSDGVAVVDPEEARRVRPAPAAVVDALSAGGTVWPAAQLGEPRRLRLPVGRRSVELRYAALSFIDPERIQFRYRLEGVDEDWVDAGTRRVASYASLPPGNYRFEVVASQDGHVWSEPGPPVLLAVPPLFYETRWFAAAVVAALAAIAYAAYRLRVVRLLARERVLTTLVDERTRELRVANETLEERVQDGIGRLREAERMAAYGQMVASVAHEVRQPIFAMQTATYVISQGTQEPKLARPVSMLVRETKRVNAIMDELLDFARPRQLFPVETDLGALLADAEQLYRAEIDPARVAVAVEVAAGTPHAMVDRERLVQVIVNLMQNAYKHAQGVTKIELGATAAAAGKVALAVHNDGAPIPAEVLPRMFEPFFTSGRGTGLGLAIARRIAVEHGGDIAVASGDAGTTFTITLPAAPAAAPAA